jgi:Cdc6-like AAA superfamily ATPase
MFLRKAFASERVSSILNISGIPSIGKSDTVRAAINKILSKCTENVMVVELDAHKFNSLRRLYRELLHKLTNQNNP